MKERYDAAIIGAGADGLAAAATLARKGLKTIVVERGDRPGGLLTTIEFHPGFHASAYLDEIAPVPPHIYWSLDLSRRGAVFLSLGQSLAVWPDRHHLLTACAALSLPDKAQCSRLDVIAHAGRHTARARRGLFSAARGQQPQSWPGGAWAVQSLHDLLASEFVDADAAAHLGAIALSGRAADPFLRGSGLHALAPGAGSSGMVTGGLGRLAQALAHAATDAGADIRYGLDVNDLKLDNGRIASISLVDGSVFDVGAVISTLDLKRTFLSLFSWRALPKQIVARVGAFRMAGATARVLFALKDPPASFGMEMLRNPVYVAPDFSKFAEATLAWRSGTLAAELPTTLRVVSASDPELAPPGCAVLTATLGAVPFRLFDGAWTKEKRDILRDRALGAAEIAFPGITGTVIAAEVITPNDIDEAIGATEGDLWGGEIAADQMLGCRPWADPAPPRTPIRGLYLAGPSAPLGPIATCAGGVLAAEAVMADFGTAPDR